MCDASWDALMADHDRVAPLLAAENCEPGPPQHKPKAAVLACSDARVPPSVVFDQPAGSLFVTRVAGNTAVPAVMASLDFAVAELGVELVVVLGHTSCGAVTAAVGGTCDGYLEPIVAPICAIARSRPGADVDHIAAVSVASTMAALAAHDGPVGHAARAGRLEIRGALHDLDTGRLVPVTTQAQVQAQAPSPVESS